MKYRISHPTKILKGEITLTASKSESNRVLIIQALCAEQFEIKNLAAAEDTTTLQSILRRQKTEVRSGNDSATFDVGAAGTTMRFLTAYLATQPGNYVLTGSERMKNRPIKILVDALRELGADIEYIEKDGYPPLKIKGKELQGGEIEIDGSVSSQYISALLLISPKLENGLKLKFKGEVTSMPYINMTLKMMEQFGVYLPIMNWRGNVLSMTKQTYQKQSKDYVYKVEGDWSSASYWYAFAALSNEVNFLIKGLNEVSLQGDSGILNIFRHHFGIDTIFENEGIRLIKKGKIADYEFVHNFSEIPDLAQTIAVVVAALKIPATFTGLHTLRIKETDRTAALKNELAKLGTTVEIISDDEIKIIPGELIKNSESIATYEDHRMAMAFSAFVMVNDSITIEHSEVVKKSYPDFWKDLKSAGFKIEEMD